MYALVIVVLALVVAACAPESTQAKSLDGTWKSSDGAFIATIKNNRISMDLHIEGITGLYWSGSFKYRGDRKVMSTANRRELKNAVFGSEDPRKLFVVANKHEIRFPFMVNDVRRIISLRRSH